MTMTLEQEARAVYGAYEYLRDNDFAHMSTTSRLLHEADLDYLAGRVRDEIDELGGVVAGTHGHDGGIADIVLEAYQSLYWLLLLAAAAGDVYDDLRPHELLGGAQGELAPGALPQPHDAASRRAFVRGGLRAVASLCRTAGVETGEPLRRDISELRAKPYLHGYWTAHDGLTD